MNSAHFPRLFFCTALAACLLLALPLSAAESVPAAPAAPAPAMTDAKGAKPYVPPVMPKAPPENNEILPPLFGWTRVVLRDLKMPDNNDVINACGMKRDMIFQFFAQRLQDAGIPVVSSVQARNLTPEEVTVEAEPSIVSLQDLVINCIS
ncbi:MAG TPA: hypothetical protein VHB73_06735, partial [Alphaproteobacteria bacterium]|nr:hypothetical protein [Alphaproteobacteria bacterium]